MLGSRPGDCISYFDFNRFAELFVDGKNETAATTVAALNANVRATDVVRSAEIDILEAVRTRQTYTLLELQDLVRDYQIGGTKGQQIMSLIADRAWGYAIQRKRYPAGTPQGDDPAFKNSEEKLKQLREGSRIFIMEGVQQTDGSGNVIGTYGGQERPNAGLVSGSVLRTDVGRPVGMWGNMGRKSYDPNDDLPYGW